MIQVKFYPRNREAKQATPINLYLCDSESKARHRVSTGKKIHPKDWSFKFQKVKPSAKGADVFNLNLAELAKKVETIYTNAIRDGFEPDATFLKDALAGNQSKNRVRDFWEVLEMFIEDSQTTRKHRTILTYYTLQTRLKDFAEKTRYNLTFEAINAKFKDLYHRYLVEDRRLNDTTIQKAFQILKRYLNYATDMGYNSNMEFARWKFQRKPILKIALTENEVLALETLDLSINSRLERVRDMFLFCCETSLRFSDMQALKSANIKTTELEGKEIVYMELVAQKTRGAIQAPVSEKAREILNKYNDNIRTNCFPQISNQKFNDYIKEVGKLANIDTPIQVVKHIGNERIEKELPKYQMIGVHTARRTFVTLFFERGGSVPACMVYTGHTDYKVLETYRKKTLHHRLKIATDSYQPHMKKVV